MPGDSLHKVGTVRRTFEIAGVSTRYFLLYRLNSHRNETLGRRLRFACEELGLVFIKLGQILSTRYDLLGRSDCEELQKLLDEVPPFSYETVQEIFLKDFGKLPENIFAEFDSRLIASASIAQVYKAKLEDGQAVAVKVRRPGVERAIRSDIKIFKTLAGIAQLFSSDLRHIGLKKVLGQLEEWLLAEVDFGHELKNLEQVNDYYTARSREPGGEFARALVLPRPYRNFSSDNIVVMSFIEGVSVRQFETIIGDPAYDVRASLEALMRAVLRAWIGQDELFFHGDPHPSNLVFLPGGRMGLFDGGLIGRFDHRDIQETRELFLAVYTRNTEASTRLALQMCKAPAYLNTPELREDVRAYIEETKFSGLGFWFMGFIHIFVKHRIPMPYQLVLFGRCQTILEGVFETVLPGTPALDILGEELERGIRRKIWENITETNFAPMLYVLSEKIKKSPELVAGIIDKYFDDPLQAIRDFKEAVKV